MFYQIGCRCRTIQGKRILSQESWLRNCNQLRGNHIAARRTCSRTTCNRCSERKRCRRNGSAQSKLRRGKGGVSGEIVWQEAFSSIHASAITLYTILSYVRPHSHTLVTGATSATHTACEPCASAGIERAAPQRTQDKAAGCAQAWQAGAPHRPCSRYQLSRDQGTST